jgi:Transposase DDE domain
MSILCDPTELFRRFSSLLPTHWQRRRGSLGPVRVLFSLMSMSVLGCNGYERTLQEMKRYMGEVLGWSHQPSGQALSQARRKLDPERCREVVSHVRTLCTTARSEAALGYDGFRLMALDGTKVILPAYQALRTHFGCPVQSPRGPQASFTVLWDVGANQPVDWRVGPYRECERIHAQAMIATLGAGDLLLGDRNFSSRRIMFALHERGADWLMCVRSAGPGTFAEVNAFVAAGLTDQQVLLVDKDHHGAARSDAPQVPVRLLRKDLPDGGIAVFITSFVDSKRHPAAALIELYAARWRVETAFRELKIWHGLERFHARYPDGIRQEIAALMLFQLLASELEAQARVQLRTTIAPPEPADQPPQIRTLTVRFNRRIVADCAIELLFAGAKGDEALRAEFENSLFRIWRNRQDVKPARSFVRERKAAPRGWRNRDSHGDNGA